MNSSPESTPVNQPTQTPAPATPQPATAPAPRGRPRKCTPELREALLDHLRAGLNYGQACDAIGINAETLRLWRRADPGLCRSIEEAEAQAVRSRLEIIEQASQKNWRAAAWWLERRLPQIWGPHRNISVDAKLRYAYNDRAAAHEHELTRLEVDLRTALYLDANASEEEVSHALERAKINLMRSRAYGIPVDQLPK